MFTAIALSACNEEVAEGGAQSGALPSVVVTEVTSRDVVETERFIGRAEAVDTTDLRARVEGFLEERRVREGERVSEGDTLFKIEPAPYEAALAQAEASVAEAEAALELAAVDLARNTQLLERDTISQADYDASVAQRATAEARLQAAEARRQEAEIRLGYTEMKAPFDGRIGRIEFSQGEVVGPASGTLTNITRMSPIYVNFGLSERDLVALIDWAGGGNPRDAGTGEAVLVRVQLPNERMLDEDGRLVFVDNRVDPATGTIDLRAEFANVSETLVPGMFVNVEIGRRDPEIRNILPQAALQQDQQGSYVLVVGEDDLVEQRYVQLGDNLGADVVVLSGAEAGEQVIVEGLQRVRIGQPVEPVPAAAPAGAAATEE
ncbi:efflux RND transporter periplasmic adaptor subunit [bacterium]|nr:efflux RND transporter periplasmic adaptor subunit [bacterium]